MQHVSCFGRLQRVKHKGWVHEIIFLDQLSLKRGLNLSFCTSNASNTKHLFGPVEHCVSLVADIFFPAFPRQRIKTALRNWFKISIGETMHDLLGFGWMTHSVPLRTFSVHIRVLSDLCSRFSKCASSSVFSADPSFSSVNYKEKTMEEIKGLD